MFGYVKRAYRKAAVNTGQQMNDEHAEQEDENLGIGRNDFTGGLDSAVASEIVRAANNDRWEGWLYIVWGWVAMIGIALIWAGNMNIEEVTTGDAKIVPSSRQQILQSLEGGLLQELLVHEGDTVEKGQVVARIDPTRAEASFRESANRLLALKAQVARLHAEATGQDPVYPPEVLEDPELVARENEGWEIHKRNLRDSVAGHERTRDLIEQELVMAKKLVARSLLSKTEVLKLERQLNDATLEIVEIKNRFRSAANDDLSKLEVEITSLEETALGRQDTLDRTEVRSPVHGIVNNILINTLGGVIQPGAKIMEVTPLDEQLFVETKIRPSDVAFIAPGQEATVKISAYDYSVYGGLKGRVQFISSGALKEDESRGARPGVDETYYRVMVRTEGNTLTRAGSKELRVIPGMTATVDIRTGEKTLLQYLLRPLLRVQEAFREK